jgi:DNA-binding Xre family transcriptional regulator
MKEAKLNLDELLKGRSLYWLAQQAEIDYKTIHKHARGQSKAIRFDHIVNLCEVLECTPADLIQIQQKPRRKSKK